MTWIEKRDGWLGQPNKKGGNGRGPGKKRPADLSVTDVARIMGVTRQTVYKWLSPDAEDDYGIAFGDWYKMPNGYIRILYRAVEKLRGEA